MSIVSLDSLQALFKRMGDVSSVSRVADCQSCGEEVIIKIDRTSGGFGLQGGILHESESRKLFAQCLGCHKKMPNTISVLPFQDK